MTAIPKAVARDDGAASRSTRDGYALRRWRGRDFVYYAVTDLAEDEFDAFLAAWDTQAAAE